MYDEHCDQSEIANQKTMTLINLETPFRIIISGNSGSGKSSLIKDIVLNMDRLSNASFQKIFYCCKYISSIPKDLLEKVIFVDGLPTAEMVRNDENIEILFIIDDMMNDVFKSDIVCDLVLTGRNRKLSTIITTQNLFATANRDVMLQATHLIVFRNLRDKSSFNNLSRQVNPTASREFTDMYTNNVRNLFDYLVLDFSPKCQDIFRYRSSLFENPIIYCNDEEINRCNAKRLETSNSKTQAYFVEL